MPIRCIKIETYKFYLVFLSLILAFYPTFQELYQIWEHPINKGYSHGLLLSVVVIFFMYKELSKEKLLTLDLIYLPIIVFFSILWAVAKVGVIQPIEYFSMYLVLFTLFGLITNTGRIWRLYLVLAFVFTIPIWNAFNGVLQSLTAIFSYLLLKISFIPVQREGLFLFLPNGNFIVADYCSGLRQQLIALTLISLYAYMNRLHLKEVSVILIITVLFAFILNLIRIYVIILSGYFTDMTTSLIDDHSVLGWAIFGVGMASYLYFMNRYFDKLTEQKEPLSNEYKK